MTIGETWQNIEWYGYHRATHFVQDEILIKHVSGSSNKMEVGRQSSDLVNKTHDKNSRILT